LNNAAMPFACPFIRAGKQPRTRADKPPARAQACFAPSGGYLIQEEGTPDKKPKGESTLLNTTYASKINAFIRLKVE
jgi:hypothetical protein